MQDYRNVSNLRDLKPSLAQQLKSKLWVGDRMKMLLVPWKSGFNLFASPLLLKSSALSQSQDQPSVSTILENLRINLFKLRIISFNLPNNLA